jgi:signal transduction histidine kinase
VAPDLCPPDVRDRVIQAISGLAGDDPTRVTQQNCTKDGTLIDVVTDGVAISFNGKAARLVHVTDITQQRRAETRLAQAEATLRQAEKLEAIGRLTGGIAHDFNNILAIMMVKMEGIADQLPPDSPFHQKIAAAMDAGERGADLVSRLMTFARRRPVEPEEIPLNELLDDISSLVATAISRKVTLSMDHAPDLRRCRIDRSGFETAILNLAVNARDAMPDGGKLVVATRNRTIGEEEARSNPRLQAGDWVETTVGDTGMGMPPEIIGRIFEPFFTTKAEGKGTGLGLAMVHGFIHQSGGFLTVESVPGKGTTFTLLLPAMTGAEGMAPAETDRLLAAE